MANLAKEMIASASRLEAFIAESENPGFYGRPTEALVELREAVQEEFQLDVQQGSRKRRSHGERALQMQLLYQKKRRQVAEDELRMLRGEKDKGKLGHDAIARICLSNPFLNGRQIRDTLSLEVTDGTHLVSHGTVGKLRDAFAETLKQMASRSVSSLVATAPGQCPVVFVTQTHDEASMRFRSYDRVVVEAFGGEGQSKAFNRGRYSKVQNNVISVRVSPSGAPLDWYIELQPLARKDAPTMATAVVQSLRGVLQACSVGASERDTPRCRVVHMLVGDGVNTNEAAAKCVLHHLLHHGAEDKVDFRMLVWKCASHQANLAVLVAIAGRRMTNVLENDELCGTLSRVYKYLMPSYLEEFSGVLRDFVIERLAVLHDFDSAATLAHRQTTQRLVELYGDLVLPLDPESTPSRPRVDPRSTPGGPPPTGREGTRGAEAAAAVVATDRPTDRPTLK